jgi:hypothetical protein
LALYSFLFCRFEGRGGGYDNSNCEVGCPRQEGERKRTLLKFPSNRAYSSRTSCSSGVSVSSALLLLLLLLFVVELGVVCDVESDDVAGVESILLRGI